MAQELHAHGFPLCYYDNKKNGEVDFLIDDFTCLATLPLEVKSGKDYTIHSALDKLLTSPDYNINQALVFSNEGQVFRKDGATCLPIYYIMFFQMQESSPSEDVFLPDLEPVII